MEELALMFLTAIATSVASIVFIIWFMCTVARSLKEISYQLARIASMISLQNSQQREQK